MDFSSIRACFSGAAPLMAATKTQFEELTGGHIVEGYSLTEAMMACVANPLNGVNKIGSVGVPLPDVEVAHRRHGVWRDIPAAGRDGRDRHSRASTDGRLLQQRRKRRRACCARTVRRDRGCTRETSAISTKTRYLFIVDRQKDLIKTSGYQVWPREIEEVLALHPGVQEVGVAGVPDAVKGEVVKAWIVKRAGADARSKSSARFAGRGSRRTRRRPTWNSETRCRRR